LFLCDFCLMIHLPMSSFSLDSFFFNLNQIRLKTPKFKIFVISRISNIFLNSKNNCWCYNVLLGLIGYRIKKYVFGDSFVRITSTFTNVQETRPSRPIPWAIYNESDYSLILTDRPTETPSHRDMRTHIAHTIMAKYLNIWICHVRFLVTSKQIDLLKSFLASARCFYTIGTSSLNVMNLAV